MSDLRTLTEAVIKGDINVAVAETQKALDSGAKVSNILNQGLIAGMDEVGEKFSKGQFFVPQMLRAAKTMQECVKLLQPHMKDSDATSKGKVLIGTVKGDLHDIGKNLVSTMMEGAGFTIIDLGVDVPPEKFAQKTQEVEPDIVAMSALLSTTMPAMPLTIEAMEKAGVRNRVKILIGGAPVTADYAQEIKADAYAADAGAAVNKAKQLLKLS